MLGQFFAACIGTISFSVIFHVNKKYYPICGLIGGIGWLVYLCCSHVMSVSEASFLATCFVAFASRAAAIYKRCPVTIFLISGIFPLVPGAGIYWAAYYLIHDKSQLFNEAALNTVKISFAIVLGIILIFEIPQVFFRVIGKCAYNGTLRGMHTNAKKIDKE